MTRTEVTDLLSKAKAADNLYYEQIIQKWKAAWMSDAQNPPEEHKNYFHRAFGIDANMKHSLAKMLAEDNASESITRLAESYLEALEVIRIYDSAFYNDRAYVSGNFAHEFLRKIGET